MPDDVDDGVLVKNGNSGGSDYTVVTDYVTVGSTTGHVQFVKLVDGTADSGTAVPGTTSGLGVVPRQDVQAISVNSTGISTATTYASGDQVGTIFNLTDAARTIGGTGSILGISLLDKSDVIGSVDVVLLSTTITLAADNAAFSITDADAENVVEVVSLNYAMDLGGQRFARLMGMNVPYKCNGGTSLYAALITRTANSPFAAGVTGLRLTVYVARD